MIGSFIVQLVVHFCLQCTSGCSLPGLGTMTDSKVDGATIAVYPSCLLKFFFPLHDHPLHTVTGSIHQPPPCGDLLSGEYLPSFRFSFE